MSDQSLLSVLCIAGIDPSGGAGLLMDVRTIEACGVKALAVASAITVQTEKSVRNVSWIGEELMKAQIKALMTAYEISYVKVGLVESSELLLRLIRYINELDYRARIIWDPIYQSSSGFVFHQVWDPADVERICRTVFMFTPNIPEMASIFQERKTTESALWLSRHCHVLLKGGHDHNPKAVDVLYDQGEAVSFESERIEGVLKRGTGCMLSSAIAAYLSLGDSVNVACMKAKDLVFAYISGANIQELEHNNLNLN